MKLNKGIIVLMTILSVLGFKDNASAANVPIYHRVPAYQEKDFFETEKVKISGIQIEELKNSDVTILEKPVKFEIYNCTRQEIECEVMSEGGMLPEMDLVKNHNYIIFAKDTEYIMENVYVWVQGNALVDIKKIGDINNPTYDYPEVNSLQVQKRQSTVTNPEEGKRVFVNLPVKYGEAIIFNAKIKLISEVETIETTSGNRGYLRESLLEDIPYMVQVEHAEYGIETFPLVVKDKSEYNAGKYTYDFSNCKRVESINLVKKADEHNNDTSVSGLYGRARISGMNFKDMLLIDKKMDVDLDEKMDGRDYEVLSMIILNPHRWEIGKFPVGNYRIELSEEDNREIKAIYLLKNENELEEIEFNRENQTVSFVMDNISICPVVVEVEKQVDVEPKAPASAKAVLTDGHDDVKFSWSKVTGADGYLVYYKKSSATKWSAPIDTTAISYVVKNLTDNVTYNFKVVPYVWYNGKALYNSANNKTASVTTKKVLKAPETVKAVLSGDYNNVKITWSKVTGATGYYVYRKKGTATSYTKIAATKNLTLTRKNLTGNVKYTYKVVPYYLSGSKQIAGKNGKTATVYALKKLAAPKVVKVSAQKVKVSWTNINGESGYQISRSTKKTGTNIVSTYGTTSGKTKILTIPKKTKYYYKVRAYKTVNGKKICSPWSNVTSHTMK